MERQDLIIRELTVKDTEAYRELRLAALLESPSAFGASYEDEAAYPPERWHARLASSADRFTLGAFLSGTLVGSVTFYRESYPKLRHKGNLVAMHVRPEHRGRGIGRMLGEALITRAKQLEGLEQINLCVNAANVPAKRLYAALGFQRFGVEPRALKVDGEYFAEEYMVLFLED